ncbi:MAG: SH3 domain-containing protein [Candidatus Omnitrophota bacterium]
MSALILNAAFSASFAAGLEPFIGEITENNINIRSDSTSGAESLSKVNKGQRIEIVSQSYDWYKIRLPLQVACFVKKEFVDISEPGNGAVTGENVNIRFFPSESSIIAGRADENEPVTILGETDGWYKINPVRNSFGWVHKNFIRKAAVQEMPRAESAISIVSRIPAGSASVLPATTVKPSEQRTEMQVSVVIPEIPKLAAIPAKRAPEAPVPAVPETEGIVTLTGLVKTYGNVINRPATHKLITKNKHVYLLKYNPASLNEMVFHTVRITGRQVSLPKTKFPVIEVEKIEILD